MHDILDEHRHYLADAHRIEAYRRALAASVRDGDVVLDLGAGTGILGLLACAAGARRVYAVDDGPILNLAADIARVSAYADRITHLRGQSSWVELPEPVDVIVADQIGYFGFEAGIFEALPDARRRWLKPGGRVVPARVDSCVAPVELLEARADVDFWQAPVAGFDLSAAWPAASSVGYPVDAAATCLLAPGVRALEGDVAGFNLTLEGESTTAVSRSGRMDGLLGWFVAELAAGVTMTNGPGAPQRIRRKQLFLPTPPVEVSVGDSVRSRLVAVPQSDVLTWTVDVQDAGGQSRASSRRSTVDALLLSPADVRRSAPETCPVLSRRGLAAAEVLRQSDGQHSVAAIERALTQKFPDVFADSCAAGPFVAEILARHGR